MMKEKRYPLKISFTDTETTGLDAQEDEIIQLAAIKIEHYDWDRPWLIRQIGELEFKINPTKPVSAEAQAVNGYKPENWTNAVSADEAILSYFRFVEWTNFGGQNPHFDRKFIDATASRLGIAWPKLSGYRLVAVEMTAWSLYLAGKVDNVKQETLAAFFGLGKQKHDALDDVRQSIKIYEKCLQHQFGQLKL